MNPQTSGQGEVDRPQLDLRDRAFCDLYDRHFDEVYRYVYRRCLDHSLAEDIVQDVFTSAVHALAEADLTVGWLIRTARNRLLDIVRRSARHRAKLQVIGRRELNDLTDEALTVIEKVELQEALKALSEKHRVILVLHYVDDMTIDDLGEQLNRSPKGVEALLTRARAALRQSLEAIA